MQRSQGTTSAAPAASEDSKSCVWGSIAENEGSDDLSRHPPFDPGGDSSGHHRRHTRRTTSKSPNRYRGPAHPAPYAPQSLPITLTARR